MSVGWLLERMSQWQNAPAVVWQDQVTTYGELQQLYSVWKQRLAEKGVAAGDVAALEAEYSPNACALLLALIDLRTVVVPLTRSVEAQRDEFLQIAEVQWVITLGDDDSWQITSRPVTPSHLLLRQLCETGDPGLVLFSSGSTGKSKAVLHNFARLLEKFKVPRQRMVTLTFLLLDHIGGINTLLYTLSNGGIVVATANRDPGEVCRLVQLHKIELIPTSPTFLNLLLMSEAYKQFDLSSLKLVTYGTEVMPDSTLQRLRAAFPNVRLQQTYGLSELGILRSKSRADGTLWVKIGGEGFETKVVDGILWIRAQSAMLGYLNAPSPFDAEGWMNTGDVVEVDGEYLRILGRKSEVINVGGQKVSPTETEEALLQAENIRDVMVYGERNPITGWMVVARLNLHAPEDPAALKKRLRAFCRERLAPYKVPAKFEISEEPLFSSRFKKIRHNPQRDPQGANGGSGQAGEGPA